MSHYNPKGMASDLSLGRPTSGGESSMTAAPAARQHSYNVQQQAAGYRDQKQLADEAEYGSGVARLECYMRALQGERDKLDPFRRELPICMSLLDDAIQASREKLTKVVASTRMVACQASYSNYGSPTYAASVSKGGGVPSTPPSDVQQLGSSNRYSSSWGSACKPPLHAAHASDHHDCENQQPFTHSKEAHSNTSMFAAPPPPPLPHPAIAPSHLHFINYAHSPTVTSNMLISKFHQKEATIYNQEGAQLEMMRHSIKTEGFHTHEFSSSHNQEHEHIMTPKEGAKEYERLHEEDIHGEDATSPRAMIPNMPDNNMNSIGGIGQTPRKARRCWSPELHQLFLHALHQLGGPQLATPKQIRELMHVEGLTNDEVKSHLQKFRLHTRRPAPIAASEPAQQPHHLVLFGGIWVPTSPAESAPAAAQQLAAGGGGGHAASSGKHSPYVPFHQVISGPNAMQTLMSATSSDQLDVHAGLETASEVDVARSDQSTSQNGGPDTTLHEDEDTEIHLGQPMLSREITSPIAKAHHH